ncbi:hypothetical protein BDW22DRAFT_1411339 [Trametopsis cervina]|nr:hypothetical protein BDW22DRAFT_1411339 [Trametopsis cervina]
MYANEPKVVDATVELPVTFVPALFLQRRAWVFRIMRRERITQVLDAGCGEGEAVACLCNPAPWLPLRATAFPTLTSETEDGQSVVLQPDPATVHEEGSIDDKDDYLHIRTLHALDISLNDLNEAIPLVAPSPPPTAEPTHWPEAIRWEPLEAKVWHGGMEAYNPEFVGLECIIFMEVIEHLPEDVLMDVAPMLLGLYHPRLLLITTPSYTFNSRFTAPDAPPSARRGIPDPTGRTDRIFRHWDHKFEWTVEEFSAWCEEAAAHWGYEVEVSSVGSAIEPDPWGREEQLGQASQVAAFRRLEGENLAEMRERKCAEDGILDRARTKKTQTLLASYRHEQSRRRQATGTLGEIGQLVQQKMEKYKEPRMTVHELWCEQDICWLCGGWLQNLVAAIKTTDGLSLQKVDGSSMNDWAVHLDNFKDEQLVVEVSHEAEDVSPPASSAPWTPSDVGDSEVWSSQDVDKNGWGVWGDTWGDSEPSHWDVESGPGAVTTIATVA